MLSKFWKQLFRKPVRWGFYDLEIVSCIPKAGEANNQNFKYCEGWHDHTNMGIACIATYSSWTESYSIFAADQLQRFQKWVNSLDVLIGFNSVSFDDKVARASGLQVNTNWDFLSEVWVASGLPPTYTKGVTVAGYNLEALARANLGMGKTGSGSLAPQLWQQGQYEQVKLYCLNDVYLSVALLRRGWAGELIDPVTGEKLKLRSLTSRRQSSDHA